MTNRQYNNVYVLTTATELKGVSVKTPETHLDPPLIAALDTFLTVY